MSFLAAFRQLFQASPHNCLLLSETEKQKLRVHTHAQKALQIAQNWAKNCCWRHGCLGRLRQKQRPVSLHFIIVSHRALCPKSLSIDANGPWFCTVALLWLPQQSGANWLLMLYGRLLRCRSWYVIMCYTIVLLQSLLLSIAQRGYKQWYRHDLHSKKCSCFGDCLLWCTAKVWALWVYGAVVLFALLRIRFLQEFSDFC